MIGEPCRNCTRPLRAREGRECAPCRAYRSKYGRPRPPALQAALDARRRGAVPPATPLRLCSDCTQRPTRQGLYCGPCAHWRSRHGTPRPADKPLGHSRAGQPAPNGRWRCVRCDQARALRRGAPCPTCSRKPPAPLPHRDAPDCRCNACHMRRRWATGQLDGRPRAPRMTDWTPPQDARLRALAGQPLSVIAAQLEAEFGIPRTPKALEVRLARLGDSRQLTALSARQVRQILGVAHGVVERWLHDGWLEATRLSAAPRASWVITEAALEAFLRAHVGAYYWPAIRVRRWRSLAEVLARGAHYVPVPVAAAHSGLSAVSLRRWARTGQVPSRWQCGARRGGQWVVDVYAVLARVEQRPRPAAGRVA